jgi:hypothetical protein
MRVPIGGDVYAGEKVQFVAPSDSPPPRDSVLQTLEPRDINGVHWRSWLVRVGSNSIEVRNWLTALELSLVPAPWTVTPVTTPAWIDEGKTVFRLGDPIVVNVTPPEAGGLAALRLRTPNAESIINVRTDHDAVLFTVTPTRTGPHRLTIGDAPEGCMEFDVGNNPPAIEPVRLRLCVDEVDLPIWQECRLSVKQTRKVRVIESEGFEDYLGFDVLLVLRAGSASQRRIVPLAKAIQEIGRLPDGITNWSIDGGSLGAVSVRIVPESTLIVENGHRLSARYRVRAADADMPAVALPNATWRRAGMPRSGRFVRKEDALSIGAHLKGHCSK